MTEFRVVDDMTSAALALFVQGAPRTVLLTGGSTPMPVYEALSERTDLDWGEMEFFLSDERCVLDTDPRSNFALIHRVLLSKVPAARYPIDGAACDAAGYEHVLRERFGDRPWFDFAFYGLGPDGHTASLFPGRPEVDETDSWVVHVPEAGWEPFVPRVSLTVPVLSSTGLGVFLIEGQDKRESLRKLLAGEDIPAARMKPERVVILADRSAAPEESPGSAGRADVQQPAHAEGHGGGDAAHQQHPGS